MNISTGYKRFFCKKTVFGSLLMLGGALLLIPATSSASDYRSSASYKVYGEYQFPRLGVFGFGISNPYTSRRYNNHYYGGYNSHGYRGNRHSGRRAYKKGYAQGQRDAHHYGQSTNKRWLHRKKQSYSSPGHSGHSNRGGHGNGRFSTRSHNGHSGHTANRRSGHH